MVDSLLIASQETTKGPVEPIVPGQEVHSTQSHLVSGGGSNAAAGGQVGAEAQLSGPTLSRIRGHSADAELGGLIALGKDDSSVYAAGESLEELFRSLGYVGDFRTVDHHPLLRAHCHLKLHRVAGRRFRAVEDASVYRPVLHFHEE